MQLKEALETGPVARVIVAEVRGSTPREVGAEMWIWSGGQHGTIGGGTLEYEAAEAARRMTDNSARATTHALGPDLGQCCGGAVTLVTEVMSEVPTEPRAVSLGKATKTPAVERALAEMRNGAAAQRVKIVDGWMLERPIAPTRDLWIWGAGHVGQALVNTISPLTDFALTWIDTAPDRFPSIPHGVTQISAAKPELLMSHAPARAEHLIVTYSHALDFALCDAALRQGFAFCGLIGSKTKWARFRSRLRALGHDDAKISSIACPIGDPALGKHPQAIAISVAHGLVSASGHLRGIRDTRLTRA